jgi:hypothetical protein
MNQERVKEILLSLADTKRDFTVTFTGKKSKKVNGLYKPGTAEILLHNKNFTQDNQLLYTAIHEYAHHLRVESGASSYRAHDISFWSLFNSLLDDAETKGIYQRIRSASIQKKIDEAKALQHEILLLEQRLGVLLQEIQVISENEAIRYEDIIQHDLQLSLVTVKNIRAISALPTQKIESLSLDAARVLISNKGNDQRVIGAIESGKSIAQIKTSTNSQSTYRDEELEKEKKRIERTITALNERLRRIVNELDSISGIYAGDKGLGKIYAERIFEE